MTARNFDIFVVHSPFQLFVAEHIVSSMPTEVSDNRWLIIDSWAVEVEWKAGLWSEVTLISPGLGGSVLHSGPARRRIANEIVVKTRRQERVSLWLANVQWPLNNLLYSHYKLGCLKSARLCNFPEGLGSLLGTMPDWTQRLRDRMKVTTRLFGGSGYFPYTCDLMGIGDADCVYSLYPRAIERRVRGDLVQIPEFTVHRAPAVDRTLLFVGQNYDDHMPLSEYENLCLRAGRLAQTIGADRLLYKPHHYSRSSTERDILADLGFVPIAWNGPIESYLVDHPVHVLVSYNSSALVHAKLMFGDRIEAISVFSDEVQKYLRQNAATHDCMKLLFSSCGVKIVTAPVAGLNRVKGNLQDVV